MAIKITTDSASDLPRDLIQLLNIEVFPILVYVDGIEYKDSVTIQPDLLYSYMQQGSDVKTAQIPLNYFIERFRDFAKAPEDHYIYLAFSSNLSGTYQTATLAYEAVRDEFPDFQMTIIDTKCVSLGLGIIVCEAAKRVQEGATYEAVMAYINHAMAHMEHVFSVDNLEYLLRGGRVSRSQAIIGNLLNIKPILRVDDGFLVPFDKAKGKKRLLSKLFDYIAERGKNLDVQTIGIAHTLNETDAMTVKAHFETAYGTRHFIINQLGCAVGAHCGPGMITIFFMDEII